MPLGEQAEPRRAAVGVSEGVDVPSGFACVTCVNRRIKMKRCAISDSDSTERNDLIWHLRAHLRWRTEDNAVLEKYPNTPMSHKEILQVIQKEGLKEISGTSPLACLNAMLHTNSRGEEGIFYKVPGRMGVYTLKKDVPDGLKELSDGSEESSDAQSDSQSSENSSSSSSSSDGCSNKDGKKSRWKRKVSSRLSQTSSPQSGCPSPSIQAGKVISSSQKHSKKALKQALKQQQQKQQQQQCRAGMPVSSSQHALLKAVKAAGDSAPAKPAWEGKQSDGQSSSPQNSTSSSSPSVKLDNSLPGLGKKPFQRSDRLHARQLKRTKCAEIDVETPDSILVNTNLRALINKHTFSVLPSECQQRLLLLLPEVDRQVGADGLMKLSGSALNNEFFTSAAQGWKERLSEVQFHVEVLTVLQVFRGRGVEHASCKNVIQIKNTVFIDSSGLSPEESKRLTANTSPAEPESETPAAEQPKRAAASLAPLREEVPAPLEPKAQAAQEAPAPRKGGEERREDAQPKAAKPAEAAASPGGCGPKGSNRSLPVQERLQGESNREKPPTALSPAPEEERKPPAVKDGLVKETLSTSVLAPSKPKSPEAGEVVASVKSPATTPERPEKKPPANEEMEVSVEAPKRKSESGEAALATTPEKKPRVMESCQHPQAFRAQAQSFPAAGAPVPRVPPLKVKREEGRAGAASRASAQLVAWPEMLWPFSSVISRNYVNACYSHGHTPAPPHNPPRAQLQQSAPAQARPPASGAGASASPSAVSPLERISRMKQNPPSTTVNQVSVSPYAGGSDKQDKAPSAPAGPGQACGAPAVRDSSARGAGSIAGASTTVTKVAPAASGGTGSDASKSKSPSPPTSSLPAASSEAQAGGAAVPVSSVPPADVAAAPPALKSQANSGGAFPKPSSSIPANNPLVTQLLQGKNVPLEQILPKPLTKAEMKTVPLAPHEEKGAAAASSTTSVAGPGARAEGGEGHSGLPTQQLGKIFCPNRPLPHIPRTFPLPLGKEPGLKQHQCHEALSKTTQEQILQTLIKRVQRQNLLPVLQPSQLNLTHSGFQLENSSTSQRLVLGFVGRRTSKPAMSGHYLLNISTYGRGSESLRRGFSLNPETRLCLTSPADAPKPEFGECEETGGDGSSSDEGDADDESTGDERELLGVKEEPQASQASGQCEKEQVPPSRNPSDYSSLAKKGLKTEAAASQQAAGSKENIQAFDGTTLARDFIQAAQEQVAQAMRGKAQGSPELFSAPGPASVPPPPGNTSAQLLGPSYSGTINVSTSPDVNQGSLMTGLSDCNQLASSMGNVMSFSVTVTALPGSPARSSGGHAQTLPVQAFAEDDGAEDSPSKCYCRLKAMIMCKGCGAFCHDDCIGPSKLCVSCLVVR
ncbi:putative Polycomb group protein ASXL2 [Athene cunicularia]|uniref:putative Polycomb group protein ASXL2 n=1 Tax=Athene cunicularia TaxID=194338 RepID=UPI000EF73E96|nr:putative Polycomb group protein ASXL2 [Athene cunicularia]